MNGLSCQGVWFRNVLKGIDLSLRPGRVCALLGPSGTGKTTLLWVLAGLWQANRGKVFRDGGRIGMVFQQPGLWDHLTVEQHLKLVGASPSLREQVMAQMNLLELRRRKPGSMSGGERQRLSIARALAVQPDWLLLDEPMAHLDGPARSDLFELLRNVLVQTRAGVIMATHHAHEALSLADESAVMLDGRIVQQGDARQVYRHPVSLEAAQITGEASLFQGRVVRPEQLRFIPADTGPAIIRRCDFLGHGYRLLAQIDHETVTIRSDQCFTTGTHGIVQIKPSTDDHSSKDH